MSLISIAAAAEILGVSRATAYRLARDGRIPTVRVTERMVRVHEVKLRAWIDSETDANTAASVASCPKSRACSPPNKTPAQLEKDLDELMRTRPLRKG